MSAVEPAGPVGAPDAGGSVPAGRVLVVCTGNVCRSPYIERRLAQLLDGTGLVVSSAGTRAMVGAPIEPGSVELLERAGADAVGFASRQLTPAILAEADLVVAATQRHRSDAVALNPRVLRRTFTLGELADLLADTDLSAAAAEANAEVGSPDATPWVTRVAEAARDRRGFVRARAAEESDIPDPYGRGAEAYALMGTAIEDVLPVVAGALRPPTR
ncbi:low molecular weight phosphatase family protein [Intrasporangium flavum]|uniref:arsenate reductase/protein-tyrosine-phosphatase family protein n=1 Tax=Intrasporangium flavum TaxID=1428657 RepID=UPI001A95DE99|nr:low molecular weight phosphatase family protein [Intrasporangium flavum]